MISRTRSGSGLGGTRSRQAADFPQPLPGRRSLQELYRLAGANPQQRATVPLLDPGGESRPPVILSNESAELVQLLNRWPGSAMDLELSSCSKPLSSGRSSCSMPHDGVYRCGFARSQTAYNLLRPHCLLRSKSWSSCQGPWLCGEHLTLADVRLFPTLIRWERCVPRCLLQPPAAVEFPCGVAVAGRFLALPGC